MLFREGIQANDINFGAFSKQMVYKVTKVDEIFTKEEGQGKKPSGAEHLVVRGRTSKRKNSQWEGEESGPRSQSKESVKKAGVINYVNANNVNNVNNEDGELTGFSNMGVTSNLDKG